MDSPQRQRTYSYSSGSCSSSYDDIRRVQKIADLPDGKESFTVLNYNVLAQDLIDIHKYLYRDHEPKNLEWSQRKEVLRRQFLQADADILALQEVQEDHIPTFYQHLEDRGYKGHFKKRTNKNITDGCAVYYRTNKFDFINVVEVEYNQPGISILDKPNVALIVRLKHKANNKELIIANTHLLYNPKRWDIRLAQIQVLLAEIHRIVSSTKSSPSILLVGDLNSQPGSPIVTLLESGSYEAERTVLPDHLGILPNCTHRGESKLYNSKLLLSVFDSDDETCEGPNDCSKAGSSLEEELESSRPSSTSSPRENYLKSPPSNLISHGFNFSTTYESVNTANERKATTYQDKWVLVDYMFYSNLTLISRQTLPTVDECRTYIEYIPSETVGSDHLPLLATYAL